MISRPLEFYEARHANLNICVVLFIDANLTKKELDQAWYCTQLRHPILRMGLESDPTLPYGFRFQEKTPVQSIPESQFRSEIGSLTDESCSTILQKMANLPRSQCPEMWYIWLHSNPNHTQHQLFFLFNHSGSDGPGVLAIIQTFFDHLERTLSHEPMIYEESLEFLNLEARIPLGVSEISSFHASKPIFPALSRQSIPIPTKNAQFMMAGFTFDVFKTKSLLDAIKFHGATVQAAFSCAEMLAVAIKAGSNISFPIHMAPCILVDIRKYVSPPISAENSVCGSSGMIWEQELGLDDSLWGLVQEATHKIKAGLKANHPLKYRFDLQHNHGNIQFTFMNSSVGRVPARHDNPYFKLRDVKILAGAYDGYKTESVWTLAHSYTVQDKLSVSFGYTYPSFSDEWATQFVKIIENFLMELATSQSENETVAQFISKNKN